MGNLIAPGVPAQHKAFEDRPSECPGCGHTDLLQPAEFSLVRRIFGRQPKPYTCAHTEVEQDALVDDVVRCSCSTSWHIS